MNAPTPTTAQVILDHVRAVLAARAAGSSADDCLESIRKTFEQGTSDGADFPHPFSELRPSGLLWLVNRAVFYPRGYALALVFDVDGVALGWHLQGDGSEPFWFSPEDDVDSFAAVEQTLRASSPSVGQVAAQTAPVVGAGDGGPSSAGVPTVGEPADTSAGPGPAAVEDGSAGSPVGDGGADGRAGGSPSPTEALESAVDWVLSLIEQHLYQPRGGVRRVVIVPELGDRLRVAVDAWSPQRGRTDRQVVLTRRPDSAALAGLRGIR